MIAASNTVSKAAATSQAGGSLWQPREGQSGPGRWVRVGPVQWGPVQWGGVRYSGVQYSAVQYSRVQYSAVQYSTVGCSTVGSGTVGCSTVGPVQWVRYSGVVQYPVPGTRSPTQYPGTHHPVPVPHPPAPCHVTAPRCTPSS